MKSIKNLASLPGAWICSPKDKGRKSIKRDNIYLKNNEEFLIELFNPLTESVLADIKLNGRSISESGLIIKPGQRVYLDCFIDDGKKFIFQTYDVDGSDVVKDSIKNNGDVQIFFYKESFSSFRNWTHYPYKPWGYPTYPTYPTNPFWYGTTTSTTIIGDSNLDGGILRSCSNNSYNVSYNNFITTGRIEKGDKSDMEFETDYNSVFEKNYIRSVSYKLLPDVMEPVEIKKPKKIGDVIELIRGLGELYESGVLTKDEFETKKSELLSRI